ncbi:unnamed protein product [Protopolystoma xenopodis]|uniref:Uncharacterized protein n=1 Tax=Protopolystoma xenopodis TaxID=117903 RepID=A0A3S5AEF6_9PLAT|nr:unnamed protein product [Protopolystoma xenopodis]
MNNYFAHLGLLGEHAPPGSAFSLTSTAAGFLSGLSAGASTLASDRHSAQFDSRLSAGFGPLPKSHHPPFYFPPLFLALSPCHRQILVHQLRNLRRVAGNKRLFCTVESEGTGERQKTGSVEASKPM